MNLKNTNNIRVALDIDDTILDFWSAYIAKFNRPKDLIDVNITRNVRKLMYNKAFWENLELLEKPNFEPFIYATKRINSKVYTRNSLVNNGLPIKPIYQTLYQKGNKANIIKGRCDVLIDDSIFNVTMAIKAGLPALLISRPHNINHECPFRISKLDINEIVDAYNNELITLGWN